MHTADLTAATELQAVRGRLAAALQAPTAHGVGGELQNAMATIRELTSRGLGAALQVGTSRHAPGAVTEAFVDVLTKQRLALAAIDDFVRLLDERLNDYAAIASSHPGVGRARTEYDVMEDR